MRRFVKQHLVMILVDLLRAF